MLEKIIKKLNNRGSSFVVMIVSMSFLAILAASILTAVGYTYQMKLYNLNSKNNFYYVEEAMDEIQAGVGSIAMKYLQKAYDDTIKVMVYYDASLKAYVTRDDEDANVIMKQTFLKYLSECDELSNEETVAGSGVTKLASTLDSFIQESDITLDMSAANLKRVDASDSVIIKNVTVKRTATYSIGGNSENYVQSITTDLVLGEPGYDVSFAGEKDAFSTIYDYALIADAGIEITGSTSNVNISGDVYGANDFYNKVYNKYDGGTTSVTSYQKNTAPYKDCNGLLDTSMYSGLYVAGATVTLQSNRVVVPGTIGVFNDGSLVVSAKENGMVVPSDVWADSIVLGGYTTTAGASDVNLYANAYIYDDLELNADLATFKMQGKYYGYNYSQAKDSRVFIDAVDGDTYSENDGHFNSSSIILNGQGTTLDFEYLDALYIAGRSYVEMSKKVSAADSTITTPDGEETVSVKSYVYDNTIDDYVTGESLSVKSNQLAYMPLKSWVEEDDGDYYVNIRSDIAEPYTGFFRDLSKVPLIKQTIDGNDFYFFDFDEAYLSGLSVGMDDFIVAYSNFFETDEDGKYVKESAKNLKDITNYKKFKVDKIILPDDTAQNKIYSTGALTVMNGTKFSLVTDKSAEDVFDNMLKNQAAGTTFTWMQATEELDLNYKMMKYFLTPDVDSELKQGFKNILNGNLDSVRSVSEDCNDMCDDFVKMMDSNDLDTLSLTPMYRYFNVASIRDISTTGYAKLDSGYEVWISDKNVTVSASNADGRIQGIVICKGDVTFDSSVKSFEGMIVSGSKIYIGQSINFIANPEIPKAILRECSGMSGSTTASSIIACFKDYNDVISGGGGAGGGGGGGGGGATGVIDLEKPITEVNYKDVLYFENWKKNVE